MANEKLTRGRPATGVSSGGDIDSDSGSTLRIVGFDTMAVSSSQMKGAFRPFAYAARPTAATIRTIA